jgi:hypothetical protein
VDFRILRMPKGSLLAAYRLTAIEQLHIAERSFPVEIFGPMQLNATAVFAQVPKN